MARQKVSDEQFSRTKHRYTDPRTKERVTSVTTIVGCFDSGDKLGRGAFAAVKIERAGGNYREVWDAKRDLGTRVHGYAARWAIGKEADVERSDEKHVDAFAAFCRYEQPEWISVEEPVVSSYGYGGRYDAIAWLPRLDCFALIDLKTGKAYKPELALQLSGYRNADGIVRYDVNGWATELEPLPHIDRTFGLYLHEDGGYDPAENLVEVDSGPETFGHFLNLLAIKKWSSNLDKEKVTV